MTTDNVTLTPGWRCASMHDPAGRRGIWYRVQDGVLEVRGGRRGDDADARIERASLPAKEFDELVSALGYGAWMQEEYGPNTDVEPRELPAGQRTGGHPVED